MEWQKNSWHLRYKGHSRSLATALVGGNASEEEDSCFEKKAQTLQSHAKQGTAALASDLVKP